ncbi:MAG: 50S ribosomal protein L23 [Solitalea-like symbiont of Acarus siro]
MNFSICKPLITEKSNISSERNKYTFIVDVHATKSQIRASFMHIYNNKDAKAPLEIASINTVRYLGKKKRRHSKGGSIEGKKSDYKKAIITLKKGDSIDMYSVPDIKE